MIRVSDIKTAVAREYQGETTVELMNSPSGRKDAAAACNARPRQLAMFLALRLTRHSKSRIGDFFGNRDHTTVLHAYRAVERRRRNDPKLLRSIRVLTVELLRKDRMI